MKLLHAADLHLDSPFAGLPPEEAAARRARQRQLAAALCRLADSRGCAMLLLAGDVLDSTNPYPETLETLRRAFAACRCEIFIAPGNHDYFTPDGPWAGAWPENVHIFSAQQPAAWYLPDSGWTVCGAAFTGPEAPALLEGFHAPAARSIMVLHGEAAARSKYNPVSRAQIAASGLQYLALGHIHACSGLQCDGRTFWAWPGCPEGRGFDECGQKGVLEVTLEEDGGVQAVFLALPGCRYETCTLALPAGADPVQTITQALPPSDRLHLRLTLTGPWAAQLPALQRALEGQYASLELRAAEPLDLWQEAEPGTLRGLFLQDLQAQWQTADPARRAVLEEAARLGLAALTGREVTDP